MNKFKIGDIITIVNTGSSRNKNNSNAITLCNKYNIDTKLISNYNSLIISNRISLPVDSKVIDYIKDKDKVYYLLKLIGNDTYIVMTEKSILGKTCLIFKSRPQKKEKNYSTKRTIEHIITGKKTIVIIHNEDGTYTKGEARCHDKDTFDEKKGLLIACSRALNMDLSIPSNEVKINKTGITTRTLNLNDFTKEELEQELGRRKQEENGTLNTFTEDTKKSQYEIFNPSHWKDFLDNKLVVNCRTEEKAKEFLKLLTVMGYTGLVRESLLNYINWSRYEENTCYNILGMHGSINRYKKYGFKIVQW